MHHSAGDESFAQALEYFGATEEVLRDWRDSELASLVLPEALRDLAEIFIALQSQWRWHGGRVTGLDYQGVQAYLALSQKSLSQADFVRLQYLESLCLKMCTDQMTAQT